MAGRWIVRTPSGDHVLSVARGKVARASESEVRRLWFFAEAALSHREPEAIAGASALHAQLTGRRLDVWGDIDDLPRVRQDLQRAFQSGLITVESAPPVAVRVREAVAPVGPAPAPAPPPQAQQSPVWFEVVLVDELGEGIGNVQMVFDHQNQSQAVPTGGDGRAHHDAVGSSFAQASFASVAAVRDAVKTRWDQVRSGDYLEPSDEVEVRVLRGDSLESVGLVSEEPKTLSIQPPVALARLHGLYFDTNKCFLLPTAVPRVRGLVDLYQRYPNSTILVVGHADTTGEPEVNDPLSLERAEVMAAYMRDDVDAWLAWYKSGKPKSKRWGGREDKLMIRAMSGYEEKPAHQDPVRWYQKTRGLSVDGDAGPKTRRQLITEYMGSDGTSLPADSEIVAHGCGENFPMPEKPPGEQASWERHSEQQHRRVELFFFDQQLGIQPPVPGENSAAGAQEYPEWLRRAREQHELRAEGIPNEVTLLEMHDALFRTNSCVVLPEGEDPAERPQDHLSLTSYGLVATVLRFNEEHPGKKLFVAGHCDTTATVGFNQRLSEERAAATVALIVGDRDAFAKLADDRHQVADYKQILSWIAEAFDPDLFEVPFDCDPGAIDDDAASGKDAVLAFQEAYNQNKSLLGASADDLQENGSMGPETWGAFFDCYEYALRDELDEDADGVVALRDQVEWADDERRGLGFSEHHPVDNLGRDGYRSQANRRVEVLFFDDGEVPDLERAESNPEGSELYLPGRYERQYVSYDPSDWPGPFRLELYLHDEWQMLLPDTDYELIVGEETRTGKSDENGFFEENDLPREQFGLLRWLRASPFNPPTINSEDVKEREDNPQFLLERELQLFPNPPSRLGRCEMMLRNLGYESEVFEDNWAAFQEQYQLDHAPYYHAPTYQELRRVHGKGLEPEPEVTTPAPPDPEPLMSEDDEIFGTQIDLLLEEDGQGPVANEPWEIRDTSGTLLASGTLDGRGRATVLGVTAEKAVLVFPERDESAWPAAEEEE